MTVSEADEVAAAFERAERGRAFCQANRADLTRRYPDQFVAVVNERVIATNADLNALTEGVQAKGHDLRDVWISFMRSKSPPLLL